MKKALFVTIALILLFVAGFGLMGRKRSHDVSMRMIEPQQAPAAEKLRALGYVSDAKQKTVARKIIQSGEVTIQVKRYEPFLDALEKQIRILNGYVSNVQSHRSGEAVSSAALTLRVPPERLTTLVSWLREQGLLTSERITTEDISEQYYDLQARLENARRFEARLLEMLKTQTGGLQDLILVEDKINQTREQIEQMEGRIRYFDALTNLATLNVQVQVESVYIPPQKPTFGNRLIHAWKDSIEALSMAGQAVVLLSVSALPWIPPLFAFGWILRIIIRHVRRRNQKLVGAQA